MKITTQVVPQKKRGNLVGEDRSPLHFESNSLVGEVR